jgi:hypothetical protein
MRLQTISAIWNNHCARLIYRPQAGDDTYEMSFVGLILGDDFLEVAAFVLHEFFQILLFQLEKDLVWVEKCAILLQTIRS